MGRIFLLLRAILAAFILGPGLLAAQTEESGGIQTINWKADFRYRHEWIDQQGTSLRTRHVIRARPGFSATVSPGLQFEMRLNTSSASPTSANATLGEGLTGKEVRLDVAGFHYAPRDFLALGGGKFRNPFITIGESDLIWDQDVTMDGLYLQQHYKLDGWSLRVNLAGLWIEERELAGDTMLYALQAGPEFEFGQFKITVGASLYSYDNIKGRPLLVTTHEGQGNSVNNQAYANSYNILEGFLQFETDLTFSRLTQGLPLAVFFDLITNESATDDNRGWLAGWKLGAIQEEGNWSMGYNYRFLEKDATVGAFTDSDFKGGGTDGKGHELGLEYALSDKAILGITHFMSKDAVRGGRDYQRTQGDFTLKI